MKALAAAFLIALAAVGAYFLWTRTRPDVVEHELILRRTDGGPPVTLLITLRDWGDSLDGILDRAIEVAVPTTVPAVRRVVLEGTPHFYARTRRILEESSRSLSLTYDPGPPEAWTAALEESPRADSMPDRAGGIRTLRALLSRLIPLDQSVGRPPRAGPQ